MLDLLAEQAADRIGIGMTRGGFLVEDDRHAGIAGAQDRLALGHDAEQRDGENLEHVIDLQHIAAFDADRIVARQQQMLLHRRLATLGAARTARQQPEDAVAVAATLETSNWSRTMASSAQYIASCAPVSMPAGPSHST